jgi:hypothetical protein
MTASANASEHDTAPNGSCFVMMPFEGMFRQYYADILEPAARNAGFLPVRSDDVYSHTRNVIAETRTLVEAASVCVADLTGKNPNVLYELGLAHGHDRPVVLLAQSLADVPFDLRDRRIVQYDTKATTWADKLRDEVARSLSETFDAERSSRTVRDPADAMPPHGAQDTAVPVSPALASRFTLAEGDELFRDLLADGVSPAVIEHLLRDAGLPRGFIRVRMSGLRRPGW